MPAINRALEGKPLSSFLRYVIPSALGLLAMSTASVVDGIFVGRYQGSEALAAINLIIPATSMSFGVAFMIALGNSVAAGKYIGEGNHRGACNIYSKALLATLAYGTLLVTLGVWGSRRLFSILGAEPSLVPLMAQYFDTLIWFLPFQSLAALFYYFVRIAGYPGLAAAGLIAGAMANLFLDWLLIARLDQGLKGAALATGLSSGLTVLVLLSFKLKKDNWLTFYPWQRHWLELARACFNGLSEFINEMSAGLVTAILNFVIIKRLGTDGVAAFTVVNYSLMIGMLLSFSIADALQAVSSQCFGARKPRRMQQYINLASALVLANAALLIALLLSQGTALMSLFIAGNNSQLEAIAGGFIAVLWPVIALNGLNVVVSAYLTAIHHSLASASIAILRSLVFPLALLYVLTQWLSHWPFLLALTGAEALTLVIATLLFIRFRPHRVLGAPNQGMRSWG